MIFQNRCWVFGPGVEFTGKGGEEPLSGEERAGRLLLSAQRFAARVPGLRGPRLRRTGWARGLRPDHSFWPLPPAALAQQSRQACEERPRSAGGWCARGPGGIERGERQGGMDNLQRLGKKLPDLVPGGLGFSLIKMPWSRSRPAANASRNCTRSAPSARCGASTMKSSGPGRHRDRTGTARPGAGLPTGVREG